MEVDEEEFEVPSSSSKGEKKRFEVKKVNTIIQVKKPKIQKKKNKMSPSHVGVLLIFFLYFSFFCLPRTVERRSTLGLG